MGGGRAPNGDWLRKIVGERKIFCIDSGIEICRACDIVPDFLLGDFDSATPDSVDWAAKKKIPLEKYPVDKDFTDTQLALHRAAKIFGEHVAILTGCFGGRLDHLFGTLFTCATNERKIFLADEREIVLFVKNGEAVDINFRQIPAAVSLLPISRVCGGVSTKNLHWELYGDTLTQNFPNAISNRVDSEKISVSVRHGILAIYACFE